MREPKLYKTRDNIGKAKYTVSFHDGEKTHKDGSAFWDIQIFQTKKARSNFIHQLERMGFQDSDHKLND